MDLTWSSSSGTLCGTDIGAGEEFFSYMFIDKVVSSFQILHQIKVAVPRFEPATEGLLQIPGRICYPLGHQHPAVNKTGDNPILTLDYWKPRREVMHQVKTETHQKS
ncbi:hypothetical protein PoB_003925800 [Plakobranchus ocellatus]|uniref:Uncharacterized protein n=1 Tax=Plakobranchus ocellatus TaxID=259542 RepID=A0AAV4B0Y4_9GAST|nr:hypothetical protein PoB_003925800 [Plakobranchus ocellatus]